MTAPARPEPVPDDGSAAYWHAAAQHVLTLARCSVCGEISHPPDVVCDSCGSTSPQFRFEPIAGLGTVRSWTIMRQSFLPGFERLVPFVLVDAELQAEPKVRLVGRLLDGEDPRLQVGVDVRVTFEDLRPGVAIPAFILGPGT